MTAIVCPGMTTQAGPAPVPPLWPHCGLGTSPTDPVGCQGRRVDPHTHCLAHLTAADRASYLAGLAPGDDVDHRGTTLARTDLDDLLDALSNPGAATPEIGEADFSGAVFTETIEFRGARFNGQAAFAEVTFAGNVWFPDVAFAGDAIFEGATFNRGADFRDATFALDGRFEGARFTGIAEFRGARFNGDACFESVTFVDDARFPKATFEDLAFFDCATFADIAWFGDATFNGNARFPNSTFNAEADFDGATFASDIDFVGATFGDILFRRATFTQTVALGPMVCQRLNLSGATFRAALTVEVAATRVVCIRTRWEQTATLRLRYAALDLTDAVLTQPLAVTAHAVPFTRWAGGGPRPIAEPGLSGSPTIRVESLRGVDAMHLVLTDTDLTGCRFAGAFHLDQIRLEGDTVFSEPPVGWRLRSGVPARLTRRRTLAEEHHWRALSPNNPAPPRGWTDGPDHPDQDLTPGPHDVAPLYRALRKAFEDAKNEPDAADFYYGEMEMRRHDKRRPFGERALITGYWLLSGYGLRASRALGWLLAAMTATVLAMMLWGLPTHDPKPHTTGTLPAAGQRVDLVTDNPDPELHGSYGSRFTEQRTEKAARVVVNSVVFRSSGQNLTAAGTYIEMLSRFTEPVLLALAALAVRGRVKR
ncbi:pentapeptide repeat-containing protein [Uniformispora flossi]|uniref:pentapeptide repeat-containing protein n=1 Tax=Uniformispora flossi TaxID=3390723 RepID=UPI003C2F2CF9